MRRLRRIAIVWVVTLNYLVFCKRISVQDSDENEYRFDVWKIFDAISRSRENVPFIGRKHNAESDQYKYFYKTLSNTVGVEQFENWLRHETIGHREEAPLTTTKDALAELVEVELLNALAKKSSAMVDKPYVQKKGRNDFLVIRSDLSDPFVTVVPNDIYYNVEKKCVNWLDDCNQKGLRDRLLQKTHGPYK